MKKIVGIILISLFAFSLNASALETKEKAKELAKNVMTQIAAGNMESGFKLTQPYLTVPEHEFLTMIDQMKMQGPAIAQRFGKTLGVEVAAVEEVGQSLMLVMYIQKFEKHLLRWRFYFYKPENEWVLNTFLFDDQIHSMFNTK